MFKVSANKPFPKGSFDPGDTTLGEAVEAVFNGDDTYVCLHINDQVHYLGYKYDISCIIEDMAELIDRLIKNNSGFETIPWACNAFEYNWTVVWNDGSIEIDVEDRNEPQNNYKFLTNYSEFIVECSKILKVVKEEVLRAGYKAADIRGLDLLLKTNEKIAGLLGANPEEFPENSIDL